MFSGESSQLNKAWFRFIVQLYILYAQKSWLIALVDYFKFQKTKLKFNNPL